MAIWTDELHCRWFIVTQYNAAQVEIGDAQGCYSDAWVEMYQGGSYDKAQQHILDGLSEIIQCLNRLVTYKSDKAPHCLIPYYLAHYNLPTWKTICEAWVKDDFEGKEWTIACIDRMRQLMWDEPFDVKWAAKPTETKE